MMRLAAFLLVTSFSYAAEYPVMHRHLRRDQPGTLSIDKEGVRYSETKLDKKKPHDYRWGWNEIQKLVLASDRVEITTYKDLKWLADRDQSLVFSGKHLETAYPLLRDHLPRRMVAEIAVDGFNVVAEIPAKLLDGRGGFNGTLKIGADVVVFQSGNAQGSHTWNLDEVENISSLDPLELTIASLGTDYRLQLKKPLPDGLYNSLWRKLNVRRTH
jgi:hypothetical protein